MPDTPEEFYARCLAAADPEGRLPMPDQASWEIFPFEATGLVTKPLEPPVLPEPPRHGEQESECSRCAKGDADAVWSDDRWLLSAMDEPLGVPVGVLLEPRAHLDLGDVDDKIAAEMGVLIVRIERAIMGLGNIARVHLNRWGDGGAHLHLWFLGRPAGLLQLRGSNLPLWEEMLPRVPADVADADVRRVAATLAEWRGRAHV
jgi:hypothetical protein